MNTLTIKLSEERFELHEWGWSARAEEFPGLQGVGYTTSGAIEALLGQIEAEGGSEDGRVVSVSVE